VGHRVGLKRWSTPRSGRFTPGKDPLPFVQEAGWATGSVWTGGQRHDPAALPLGKTRYPLYRRLGEPQGRSGQVVNATLRPLYPWERPATLCTGGWVDHRVGLDRWKTPHSGRFTPGKDPLPIVQEAGWTTRSVWTGGQRHAPAALILGKTRYPLYRRLGGPQGRSGQVRKISSPPGFDPPDSPGTLYDPQ